MNAISRNPKTYRHPTLPVLGLALFLAACGADEKPKLDGERISVLNFERALAVDPRVSEQAVTLPPVVRNSDGPIPAVTPAMPPITLRLTAISRRSRSMPFPVIPPIYD